MWGQSLIHFSKYSSQLEYTPIRIEVTTYKTSLKLIYLTSKSINAMEIIIVDDNAAFREDLKFFLEQKLNHKVIAEAESGEQFLEMKKKLQSDIVLMDISMKQLDGFETAKRITTVYPYLKIIAITMYMEKVYLIKLVESGFRGCVFKNDIFHSLDLAIHEVFEGKVYFPDEIELSRLTV
jgi:DNA-binding NarL/FixJ family response regulator